MANVAGVSPTTTTDPIASAASVGGKDVSKDLFLKLMVAQLKNQNPLNPVDGTDFLMQLSQISSVEQMVEMKKSLSSIHDLLQNATGGNGQ